MKKMERPVVTDAMRTFRKYPDVHDRKYPDVHDRKYLDVHDREIAALKGDTQ
jgi:hypothetical protein